jgi:hypothetical protein
VQFCSKITLKRKNRTRQNRDPVRWFRDLESLEYQISRRVFQGMRLSQIDTKILRKYREARKERLHGKVIPDDTTVNRDLALLRRMMNLAIEGNDLRFAMPKFPMTSEAHNARTGFVERAKFEKLSVERTMWRTNQGLPKTESSENTVPVLPMLRSMLENYHHYLTGSVEEENWGRC